MAKCKYCGHKLEKFSEFEVREIDKFGDAQDVNHCDTLEDAIVFAASIAGDCSATVIEYHYGDCCNNADCAFPGTIADYYDTRQVAGNADALIAGGWTE